MYKNVINLNLLRDKREKKGLTQQEISELLGISNKTYSAMERGVRKIPLSRAISISKILNMTIEEFFLQP
jgi:transcriptional regulator with XRE-family HTH domain